MARRQNEEILNQSLLNMSDLQDQSSILIHNLNNSNMSNEEFQEMALLSADLEQESSKHGPRSKSKGGASKAIDIKSLLNQSLLTNEKDLKVTQKVDMGHKALMERNKINIS